MSSTVQRIRVPVGFAFALVFLYFAQPTPPALTIGFVIAAAGATLRIWAAGCLEKLRRLAIAGPYGYTRNPLYLGSFLMGLGTVVAGGRLWLGLLFLGLFAAVYIPVMRREEDEVAQVFGDEFEDYRRRVPRFWPALTIYRGPAREKAPGFVWARVWSNRAYNAVIGLLIVAAVLLIRMKWPVA